eukprot:m.130360 g.130360  ORF g.130360 m.130360 type:complete len:197 (-) comp29474_c1_seq1:83-673(-)
MFRQAHRLRAGLISNGASANQYGFVNLGTVSSVFSKPRRYEPSRHTFVTTPSATPRSQIAQPKYGGMGVGGTRFITTSGGLQNTSKTEVESEKFHVYDPHDPEPIPFSKTSAAVHHLDPLYGDHRIERPGKSLYIVVTLGMIFLGMYIYSCVTAEVLTPEENDLKTKQQIEQMQQTFERIRAQREEEESLEPAAEK